MSREHDEETIAELLSMLPPARADWVQAAQELPQARRELERLVELAGLDAELSQALRDDLEAALADREVQLPAPLRRELRSRIDRG